jgi:hypothetical protein
MPTLAESNVCQFHRRGITFFPAEWIRKSRSGTSHAVPPRLLKTLEGHQVKSLIYQLLAGRKPLRICRLGQNHSCVDVIR